VGLKDIKEVIENAHSMIKIKGAIGTMAIKEIETTMGIKGTITIGITIMAKGQIIEKRLLQKIENLKPKW